MTEYTDLPSALARIEELEDENKELKLELDSANDEISSLDKDVTRAEEHLASAEEKIEELEEEATIPDDISVAVHAFLDEIHRPVGTRDFTIPKSPAVDRAIIGLHDAIGRNL